MRTLILVSVLAITSLGMFGTFLFADAGCTPAELAALKKDPGGTIAGAATAAIPGALKTAADIVAAIDAGGTNWFDDFLAALDALNTFADVERELQQSASVKAELAADVADRRRIALAELRHQRKLRALRSDLCSPETYRARVGVEGCAHWRRARSRAEVDENRPSTRAKPSQASS